MVVVAMPRISDAPIALHDIEEYLRSFSDFSFELRILNKLCDAGITCEHGGSYEDPITQKIREFDIRCAVRSGQAVARLAIECKNLRPNYPMLVSCVPRTSTESFHELLFTVDPNPVHGIPTAMQSRAQAVRLEGTESIYPVGEPVGKNVVQIGRLAEKSSTIIASDSELFDKWSQALASSNDLVQRCYYEGESEGTASVSAVVPVLVVPDKQLWKVDYTKAGALLGPPFQIDRCTVFVDRLYETEKIAGPWFHISHLEIVTETGLFDFLKGTLCVDSPAGGIIPRDAVVSALKRR